MSLKMLREDLCRRAVEDLPPDVKQAMNFLITRIDQHRPLGQDGTHGDLHTPTCGCEDRLTCVHCGVGVKEKDGHWTHNHNLTRCQEPSVEYGHLAHPAHVPCPADGPNPCLGASRA